MKRKSFIIHIDALDVLDELTDEQAGQLLKAIASYQKTGAHELQGLLGAVFVPFKNQFDRDIIKYNQTCETNKNNGLKGGRPKTEKTQTVILGYSENRQEPNLTQPNPEKPYNDSDSGNGSDNETVSEKEKIKKRDLENLSVDDVQDWLAEKRLAGKYVTVDEHALLDKFKNYCLASGKKYKDYVAAYRNAFEWDNVPQKKQERKTNDWSGLYSTGTQ